MFEYICIDVQFQSSCHDIESLRCSKVNGHLEFAEYDPFGNIIYGTIKKSGNKVTFKVTDTTWTYFDDGDTYIFYE